VKGEPQILQMLNRSLKDPIAAINQLFLHARIARNWGLQGLNDYEYRHSIKAMKVADELIERILFLEGLPNPQDMGKLMIGLNVPEKLAGDIKIVTAMRANLQEAVSACEDAQDFETREILEKLLEDTEMDHAYWLEQQLGHVSHSHN
jgi:bacterioferritin